MKVVKIYKYGLNTKNLINMNRSAYPIELRERVRVVPGDKNL